MFCSHNIPRDRFSKGLDYYFLGGKSKAHSPRSPPRATHSLHVVASQLLLVHGYLNVMVAVCRVHGKLPHSGGMFFFFFSRFRQPQMISSRLFGLSETHLCAEEAIR